MVAMYRPISAVPGIDDRASMGPAPLPTVNPMEPEAKTHPGEKWSKFSML
jgi:hypothetical protein